MPRLSPPSEEGPSLFVPEEPLREGRERLSGSGESVTERVRRAEAQLMQLQRQREVLEQRKRHFQELAGRQRAFAGGRARLCRELADLAPALQSDSAEAKRRSESLAEMALLCQKHLQILRHFKPEQWTEENLEEQVERGEKALEEAARRLDAFQQGEETRGERLRGSAAGNADDEPGFWHWLKIGFAFSVPLMLFATLGAGVCWWLFRN